MIAEWHCLFLDERSPNHYCLFSNKRAPNHHCLFSDITMPNYQRLLSDKRMPNGSTHLAILVTSCWCSPLYAFATSSASENDSINQPCLFAHSSTNAAEQRFRYSLQIYEPSVPATRVPSWIAFCSQLNPPMIKILSHNYVLPHDCNTSRNDCGMEGKIAAGAEGVSCYPPQACVGLTKQIVPLLQDALVYE